MTEQHPPSSLQRRRSRRKRLKPAQIVQKVWRPALGFVLAAMGVVFLLNPFAPYVDPYTTPTAIANPGLGDRLPHWLAYENGSAVFGFILIGLALVWWFFLMRNNINNTRSLWADSCPNCGRTDMKRVHRRFTDRLLGVLGFPVRRYICDNCGWVGSRIDRSRLLR